MLRIIGALCIVTGSTGIGFWYRRKFYMSLWHLRYMYRIIELFMSEIRYGKSTLSECCRQIGQKAEEPYREALLAVSEGMESHDGVGFCAKWEEEMGRALGKVPITDKERDIFMGLSGCSGLIDNQMQVRAMEQYRDMLDSAIKEREKDLEKQGRMAAGLGIMSGLLLTVILL